MCAAFLWSGSPNSATGAKVSWMEVTKPKNEGGLGLRKLKDTRLVFSLHLIWRLLTSSGSLWVAWVNEYLLEHTSFWDFKVNTKGSWIWKKLLRLRPLAETFFRKEVHDGLSTFFWHDIWLGTSKLWNFTADNSSWYLGLHRNIKVAQAADAQGWKLRRTRNPALQTVSNLVLSSPIPMSTLGRDIPLWRTGEDSYSKHFSAHQTWELIRTPSSRVNWANLVWFSFGVPRFSFITWLAFLDRLSTGIRMRQWGGIQPCVFCGDPNEDRNHLFFGCPFSFQVWSLLARDIIGSTISPAWLFTAAALKGNRKSRLHNILLRMAFQTSIYYIWKERNSRIHSQQCQSFTTVASHAAQTIRKRIQSRTSTCPEDTSQLLVLWDQAWERRRLV